jgi:flagellar biosynthesis protein FlhA
VVPSPVEVALKEQWKRNNDVIIAGLVIGIVLLIIIPLPAWMLDIFLTLSITLGLVILLITMFTTEPLQFSVFPSLLLVTTLYRLALNISSTRLILSEASAGKVIAAFGHFVISGSYIVGAVVFVIITVIQFVVITSGAGRVAEVAARFTLDAMPGKQMSIDAEFNSGLITEEEARKRRRHLQREADFFGSMDGASKFVRGDAIAGIIIIIINIVGGLTIGLVQMNMSAEEALHIYTLLTVGDGLVTQVPALLVSTATGILVTRATSDATFGKDLSRQFLNFPKVLFLAAAILFVLGLVPAMPNLLFLVLSGMTAYLAYTLLQSERQRQLAEQENLSRQSRSRPQEPENVFSYFQVDPLEIEIGYNLIVLTDEEQGGDLLYRLSAVRRQCAAEMGIFVRPIRIRDNLQLSPNSYTFKLRGVPLAEGELMPGHFLAMDPTGQAKEVPGVSTFEPTFGLKAWWVTAAEREQVELSGFTVVDVTTVMITHLTEFIKRNAHELLGRQELKELLDVVKEKNPAVVEELVPDLLSLGEIQKVFQNLLREQVPVRDLVALLEALADGARVSHDIDYLTEYVRQAMARNICRLYSVQGEKISVITLHPKLEQRIVESLQQTQFGLYPVLEPDIVQRVLDDLKKMSEKLTVRGLTSVVLCSPRVRLPLRRLVERHLPGLAVLSLTEIVPGVEVEAVGTVTAE